MKYLILIDYGSDGWKFEDEEFDSLDLAVKTAQHKTYGNAFKIVTIINWEAKQT